MARRLYKTSEVAELLSLSTTMVKNLVAAGDIPSVAIGRARRVSSDDLDAYIQSLKDSSLLKAS